MTSTWVTRDQPFGSSLAVLPGSLAGIWMGNRQWGQEQVPIQDTAVASGNFTQYEINPGAQEIVV